MAEAATAKPRPSPPPILGVVIATLVGIAILIDLGTWQMQRLAWKEGLIRDANERAHAPPQPLPAEADWPRLSRDAVEYRHVTLTGTYRPQDEVRVFTDLQGARGPAHGIGFWVLTPMTLPEGGTVVVNRGFVPRGFTGPTAPAPGPATVTGLMRWSEDRNLFTPDDNPAKGEWYTRDPAAIAAVKGLPRTAPFFVDAETPNPGGLPQAGETRLTFPNRHLEYALTWYGLAATLAVMSGLFLWRRRTG